MLRDDAVVRVTLVRVSFNGKMQRVEVDKMVEGSVHCWWRRTRYNR